MEGSPDPAEFHSTVMNILSRRETHRGAHVSDIFHLANRNASSNVPPRSLSSMHNKFHIREHWNCRAPAPYELKISSRNKDEIGRPTGKSSTYK